jgi:threonyl-tRNA synthetase
MIHRGTVGSMERVVAILLEHYQGRLPLWLAPVQVAILPVSSDQDRQARALCDELQARCIRARIAVDGSLGARIRQSRRRRDALVAVIGAAEAAKDAVHVTDVAADIAQTVPLAEFFVRLDEARAQRLATIRW